MAILAIGRLDSVQLVPDQAGHGILGSAQAAEIVGVDGPQHRPAGTDALQIAQLKSKKLCRKSCTSGVEFLEYTVTVERSQT